MCQRIEAKYQGTVPRYDQTVAGCDFDGIYFDFFFSIFMLLRTMSIVFSSLKSHTFDICNNSLMLFCSV